MVNIWPSVKIIANGNDISRFLSPKVSTVIITDEIDLNADKLEITFPAHQFAIPSKGAEIEILLGYKPFEKSMGKFIVDTRGGDFVNFVTIAASGSPQTENSVGRIYMQDQKTRYFKEGTTLGDMIATIAKDHGLAPVCDPTLAKISLPHTIQKNESDIHFLTRITARHGASVKPANGKLICTKRASGKNANGNIIPPFQITPSKISRGTWKESDSDGAGTVIAKYRDIAAAKMLEAKAGNGKPKKTLPQTFPNKAAAQAAAQATLDKITQTSVEMSFTMPGDPDIFAGRPITLQGFETGIPTNPICTRVTHILNTQGYSMNIEAEMRTPEKGS